MPRTEEQLVKIREKAKNAIKNAALKLFANKGFHGSSMNDIAKAAGVSKGLAYNYFANKEDIVQELFADIFYEFGNMYSLVGDDQDPFVKLEKFINVSFDYIKKNEQLLRLFISLALQPEIIVMVNKIISESIKEFYKYIESLLREMDVKNPAVEAKILASSLDGIALHYFYKIDAYPLDEVRKLLIKKYSKEAFKKNVN